MISLESELKTSSFRTAILVSVAAVYWFSGTGQATGTGWLLPVIQEDLNTNVGDVQWVNAAFNISGGCCALVAGRLGDMFGQKRSFLGGVAFCSLWTCISAFMPSIIGLGFTRALTGIGYASAAPAAVAIVGRQVPAGRGRVIAYAVIAASSAVGAGGGWLFAGIFSVTKYTWRPLLGSFAGLMLYPLIFGYFVIPPDKPQLHMTWRSVDWFGATTITTAQIVLTLAMTFSVTDTKRWKAPQIPPLFVAAAILFAIFLWRQRRLSKNEGSGHGPLPLTPGRFFTRARGAMLAVWISTFLVWAGMDNVAVTASYLYSDVLGYRGWEGTWRILPCTFSGLIGALLVALFASRIPARIILVVGSLLGSLSGVFFAIRKLDSPYWHFDLWGFLMDGIAADITMSICNILVANHIEPDDQGVASGIFISFARFGSTAGLAVVTSIRENLAVNLRNSSDFVNSVGADSQWSVDQLAEFKGLQAAFWCGAGFHIMGAVVIAFGMRGWEVVGKKGGQVDRSGETNDTAKQGL